MEYNRPKVGVGVVVIKNNKVLLGKRKNSHGAGTWCLPGGHLEFGESVESCAEREVLEETGLKVKNLKIGPYTNDIMPADKKHYATLFIIAEVAAGEPKVMEPDKCGGWCWFEWDSLPKPLFMSTENLVKSGFNPFKL